jgi:transposase
VDYLTSLYLTDVAEEPRGRRSYRRSVQKIRRDEEISAAYNAGRPVREIAAEFGVEVQTIYKSLTRTGTPRSAAAIHPNGISTRRRNAEIIEKYKAGASAEQIGQEYGICRERVCQLLRPHNLTNIKAEQKRIARETVEAEREQIVSELSTSRAEVIARAVAIVRAGGSRNDAIRQTGLPVHIVQKACKDAGLPHLHGRWLREADIDLRRKRAAALRAIGKTWAEIETITTSEGNKITMNFVARHFPELMGPRIAAKSHPKRNGVATSVPQSTPDVWPTEKIAELCRMYFTGCSAQQIADILGITRNAVIGKTNRLRADGQLKPPAA